MTYDGVGNLLTKIVSAPTASPAPAPRQIADEYDATKRFVIKKTDHQGFVTTFVYNTLGQVTQSTNYLGVVSDFTFDNWGKLTKTKTTGVSTTPLETTITYAKLSNRGYVTTSENTVGDNARSITQYDVLGRAVVTTTKGLAVNSTISKQVVYDGLGRKTKESEPYFSSPTRWVNYEYDYLMRPITVTQPTGRIQTLSYSGLTTTSIDDGKTTTATVDALGNKTQTTDPGGAVSFIYYANGQLKESNYEGHKVNISIDGWGNKIAMTDPNAGTYIYSYDAFGQLITETTPKGKTDTSYDAFGKVIQKKVSGEGADIITDYQYNGFSQLTTETSKSSTGGSIDTFSYTYDNLHRVVTNTESNVSFIQTKTVSYDGYGRPITGINATQELTSGLTTNITTKNVYNTYNGMMDRLTDSNDNVLWQLNTANEKMQSLTETLGN
jgi:YD repeat-containing protein